MQAVAKDLREHEINAIQLQLEREVGVLSLLRQERERAGTAGRSTKNLLQRIRFRHRKIRQLLATWGAWQAFMQDPRWVAPQVDEDEVFGGSLPWQPSDANGQKPSGLALQLAWTRATAELQRTREELYFLEADPPVLAEFYSYQQRALLRHARCMHQRGELSHGLAFLLLSKLRQVRRLAEYAVGVFKKIGLV
jgi:hypothetical protein